MSIMYYLQSAMKESSSFRGNCCYLSLIETIPVVMQTMATLYMYSEKETVLYGEEKIVTIWTSLIVL